MGEHQRSRTFPELKRSSLKGSKGTIKSLERQAAGQEKHVQVTTRSGSRSRIYKELPKPNNKNPHHPI